jgi:tripartite-type tricarboxylate transporter receptor subunit TctC
VRTAPPDGYTLLVGSSSAISVAPLLQKAVSYQPLRDFETGLAAGAAAQRAGVQSGAAGAERARADRLCQGKNGDTRMASAGIGSVSHLAGAAFQTAGGFKALHVPYKGGARAWHRWWRARPTGC